MTATLDLLVTNVHLVTLATGAPYGAIRDGAIGIAADRIAWVGRARDVEATAARTFDGAGRWVTPGLIDCHTHLVYAGNRSREFEARLGGATYEDIARSGGGILSTVRATRDASEAELVQQSRPRLAALAAEGVTTVEIKSGYGLDTATECKQLAAANRLGRELDVDVRATLLAAHTVPPEFAGRADDYVDLVCRETIPQVARRKLADAIDVFCETIAFTPEQTRRVFAAGKAHGLALKLHADQLSDSGGAMLAAEHGALSADHLEWSNAGGIAAMARSGTVAVLLPGAFYALRETRVPPIALLREASVPMAISSDCNPGTSPVRSLVLMINMACTLFRLTPAEAIAAVTVNAARALGLRDRGTLAVGQRADLALWDIDEPAELAYAIGGNACAGVVRAGRIAWNRA
jgi:imidazolonepropionase